MATATAEQRTYVLGHAPREQDRLDEQGANLRPQTERLLRAAGLAPGMRVLDVGCGTGDVSLIAADLVGPSGSVLGIDSAEAAIATARGRVASDDRTHVSFAVGDAAHFESEQLFDAVIGRLILIHLPDPLA